MTIDLLVVFGLAVLGMIVFPLLIGGLCAVVNIMLSKRGEKND